MQITTSTTSPQPSRRTLLGLDDLATRTASELQQLYRAAAPPANMGAVDGPLIGRMLAVAGLPAALGAPLRRWAASHSFVWEGKTFQAISDERGSGINRVRVPGVLGRQNLFPFATSFAPSAIDGKPTLVLDYDLDTNPGYIRHVHDEIREVSPGVFLGPAMWKRDRDKVLVLWFALDANAATRPS
jgi:hypothetical protein